MSRIRSVHPGFFKDDRLVPCSAFARLLVIGLGVEADDKGIFEWKPITIKMNVFPGDSLDIEVLLGELLAAEAIRCYEIDGRKYGAIRNFRKHQRPKTPNSIHPITPEIADYVCLPPTISEKTEIQRPPFPQKGEIAPQMEDGGGKEGSEANASAKAPPEYPIDPVERLWAEGLDLMARMDCPAAKARPNVGRWLRDARNDAGRVLDAIRRANEHGTKDPIALVGRILNPTTRGARNDVPTTSDHLRAAAAELRTHGVHSGAGSAHAGLLPGTG